MGRVRPARAWGHVGDIRYLVNLGANGEEEEGPSDQLGLSRFPLLLHPEGSRGAGRGARRG